MKRYFKITIILRTLLFVGICIAVFLMLDTQNQLQNRDIYQRLESVLLIPQYEGDIVGTPGIPQASPESAPPVLAIPQIESCSEFKYIVQVQYEIIKELKAKSESPVAKVMWLIVASFVSTLGLGVTKIFEMGFMKVYKKVRP